MTRETKIKALDTMKICSLQFSAFISETRHLNKIFYLNKIVVYEMYHKKFVQKILIFQVVFKKMTRESKRKVDKMKIYSLQCSVYI